MGDIRHVEFVDGNVGVCLPSGSQSTGEDQSGTGRDHYSSTMVAKVHLGTQIECETVPAAPTL